MSLIMASDNLEANNGTFEAGYTCAVFLSAGCKNTRQCIRALGRRGPLTISR